MRVDDVVDRVGWDQSFLQDDQSISDVNGGCGGSPPAPRRRSPSGNHSLHGCLGDGRKECVDISETFGNRMEHFGIPADKEMTMRNHVMDVICKDEPVVGELRSYPGKRGVATFNNVGEERCNIEFVDKNSVLISSPVYLNVPRNFKTDATQCLHAINNSCASLPHSHLFTEDIIAQRSNVFITDRMVEDNRTFGLTTSTKLTSSGLPCLGGGAAASGNVHNVVHNGIQNGHVRTLVGAPETLCADSNKSCTLNMSLPVNSQSVQLAGQLADVPSVSSASSSNNLSDRSPAAPQHAGASHEDAYSRAARFLAAWDLESLKTVFLRLAVCGFYFGKMSIDEANHRLRLFPVGTFLLRDSSDCRYLFALSVQTKRGTTSIRIVYNAGLFQLDSDEEQAHIMPTFDCVLALIRHYIALSCSNRHGPRSKNDYVFLESSGRKDTPVVLRKPLENFPATLSHTCRRRIHGLLGGKSVERLHLTPSLKKYLTDYPYDF